MCNDQCQYIRNFIYHLIPPLYAIIPNSFEEYFKDCETDARTCYRRALKNNCSFLKISELTEKQKEEMFEIWTSYDLRQGREINLNYEKVDGSKDRITKINWPIKNYQFYSCPNHNLELFVCLLEGKIIGYLELLNSNNCSIVHSVLGHKDYLKLGIMKYLFLETIKSKIPNLKYLIYGDCSSASYASFAFKKDLLITNCNNDIIENFTNEIQNSTRM